MSLSNRYAPFDQGTLGQALDQVSGGLELMLEGVARLKAFVTSDDADRAVDFDPKDPANKQVVGGLEKLTPRGVEICYRLFDAGKRRYAVAQLMEISFGAATHRQKAWEKAGGLNRVRQPLD